MATLISTVTAADVERAARRIDGLVRRTPIVRVTLNGIVLSLKLEQLQLTGSFKLRGATNALASLPQAGARRVVAASGGNHGLGVAHAARALGFEAIVLVARAPAQAAAPCGAPAPVAA